MKIYNFLNMYKIKKNLGILLSICYSIVTLDYVIIYKYKTKIKCNYALIWPLRIFW